ncbi:hypothetical protein, variant [Aphanomyces invadans]|uniref:EGF-like domain-containing protein n=1 Tax=Aphanomyces invadans TaxID=157072 RepID=A0A024U733_9STRA|nr:hypothetical protein H310_05690 [Aphanomyces invadans]XP_008868689.1 hypothetical protein, variant [Aphanomyces invadans]ETW02083.1 hypothetical protein H310_05690 [Aphanomyces invadans]ETW02084.1 hypothetical protein, variant [Aphanomyces invadans]|eukprot:XP_008868688.1 hypothetical protein H310_05690 [Aphanomyces invadans]
MAIKRALAALVVLGLAGIRQGGGVQGLDTDCEVDADCPATMACVKIKYLSPSSDQVRAKCALKSVCRGSSSGNCPSYNAPSAPGGELETQCVFVNTTKLRGIKCCGGTWTGGDPVDASGRRLSGNLTDPTTVAPTADSADCFQCYVDNLNKAAHPTIYVGQFFCVPTKECRAHSAFPYACSSANPCMSSPGVLCNNHGTCYPQDIDDPKTSYGCACDLGFGGDQCEKVLTDACLFDCGDGNTKGECVNDACKCKDGWTGKQCHKCAADDVCNGGSCNVVTGQCVCPLDSLYDFSWKANICYKQGVKSAADLKLCDAISCGDNGFCIAGKCFCSSGCTGTVCTPCADSTCATCTSTAALDGPTVWLAAAVLLLTWRTVA